MISIRENELVQAFKISNRIPEFEELKLTGVWA